MQAGASGDRPPGLLPPLQGPAATPPSSASPERNHGLATRQDGNCHTTTVTTTSTANRSYFNKNGTAPASARAPARRSGRLAPTTTAAAGATAARSSRHIAAHAPSFSTTAPQTLRAVRARDSNSCTTTSRLLYAVSDGPAANVAAPIPSVQPQRPLFFSTAAPVATTVETVSASSSPRPQPPVKEWVVSAHVERAEGQRAFALARELFRRVVEAHPRRRLAFDSTPSLMAAGAPSSASDTAAEQQMVILATRVAVSALLLQEAVLSLPRHQRVLEPFIRMLLRAVYVPDGLDDVCEALGGDLSLPAVLEGLQTAHKEATVARVEVAETPLSASNHASSRNHSSPATTLSLMDNRDCNVHNGSGGCNSSNSNSDGTLSVASALSDNTGVMATEELIQLLIPFARKPFFTALSELARRATCLAHAVRTQQLHTRKLPLIFAMTHVSWTRALLRTAVRAWWKLCAERRTQSQKHRTRWARRWAMERVRVGVRRWRGLAAYKLQAAEADCAAKVAITTKKEAITRHLVEAESLRKTSQALTTSLVEKEGERAVAEKELVERERTYKEVLSHVRQADRFGARLLDFLLLPAEERVEALWGSHAVAPPLGGMRAPTTAAPDTTITALDTSASTEELLALPYGASPRQLHHVAALYMLVRWANTKIATDGRDTELLCAMSPASAERHLKEQRQQLRKAADEAAAAAPAHDDENLLDSVSDPPAADAVIAAGGATEKEVEASFSAEGVDARVVIEPVFSQLLPALTTTVATDDGVHDARSSPNSGAGIGSSSAPTPSAYVPVPFYKYLVLMRCFSLGWTPDPMPDTHSDPSHDSSSMSTSGSGNDLCSAEDVYERLRHPYAPNLETVRTVKSADAAVLTSLAACQRLAVRRAQGAATAGGPSASNLISDSRDVSQDAEHGTDVASGADLLDMLPADLRTAADGAAKVLVDAYERLTGTACVVTAAQLATRGRGVQLVFLAGLLRHYTNWAVRRTQLDEAALAVNDGVPMEVALNAALSAPMDTNPSALHSSKVSGGGEPHMGRRHIRLWEWFHPPMGHLRWAARVANQRGWIALSFSALHRAVQESTRPQTALSIEEQDLAVSLVRALSLARIADVLPTSPTMTATFYVGLVQTLEQSFPRLRHVFRLYAVPAEEIVARAAAQEREKEMDSIGDKAVNAGPSEVSHGSGPAPAPPADRYVTATNFWHLLCDAGLAAGPGNNSGGGADNMIGNRVRASTRPASTSLHRVAVFSIVEHVVFSAARDETSGGWGDKSYASITSSHRPNVLYRPQQVGTERVVPLFARATEEQRHVDLRHDRGTVCMNTSQFVEALLRCAHYWQALQSAAPRHGNTHTSGSAGQTDGTGRPRGSLHSSVVMSGPIAAAAGSRLSSSTGPIAASNATNPSSAAASAGAAAVPVDTFVRYEGVLGDCPPLSPQLLEVFLIDGVLGHCLAGPGGTASSSSSGNTINGGGGNSGSSGMAGPAALPPFRRAIRHPAVLRLLAQHQESLFTVFSRYARAREAFGARSALPPPFSYANAPLDSAPSAAVSESAGQPLLSASTPRQWSTSRRKSSTPAAVGRDVGIVAVMSMTEAEALAKGCGWHRLSMGALRHCFESVVADPVREPGVLFFPEFMDLLCAVTCYMEVSPLVPLAEKLERFLSKYVLHTLQQV